MPDFSSWSFFQTKPEPDRRAELDTQYQRTQDWDLFRSKCPTHDLFSECFNPQLEIKWDATRCPTQSVEFVRAVINAAKCKAECRFLNGVLEQKQKAYRCSKRTGVDWLNSDCPWWA